MLSTELFIGTVAVASKAITRVISSGRKKGEELMRKEGNPSSGRLPADWSQTRGRAPGRGDRIDR